MEKRKIKIPDQLKNYVIQDVDKKFIKQSTIAQGGQGTVWLAVDKTNKKYAIKEILIDENRINQQVKRYLLECAALLRARHPFIIVFRGMTDQYPFQIITEYVSSVNLTVFLTDNHFKSQNHNGTHLTKIALAISNAMIFLHKIEIIHRDLKPSNILIGNDFLPKICDFGLVHPFDQQIMTAELGTPIWMAPEVIRGDCYNEKCDVFSFSMILYQMATKEIPVSELTSMQVMQKYRNDYFRPSFPSFPKVPKSLKQLIINCWDEDPDKRPSFQQIFDSFASGEVTFPNCDSNIIKKFAQKLKKDDQKRAVIPPFQVYKYKSKNDDQQNESENEKSSSHEQRKAKEKKRKIDKNEAENEKQNDFSDEQKKTKKKDREKKEKKPRKVYIDESSSESQKPNQKKKKIIKIKIDEDDDENDKNLQKRNRRKKKEREQSESDDYVNKRSTKRKFYNKKNEIIDDKNEIIFDVDTFRSEDKNRQQLSAETTSSSSLTDDSDSHSDSNYNCRKKKSSEIHQFRSHITYTNKRRPAPNLQIAEPSSYSNYSSMESNGSRRDAARNEKLYSRFDSNTPVSVEILNDIRNPMFRIELEKVKKKDFVKFMKVLKNHLTSRTPYKDLILLLRKTSELIEDDECLSAFSQKKIFEFLPINNDNRNGKNNGNIRYYDSEDENIQPKNDELVDLSIYILNKVCQSYPQCIEENFETSMLSLINLRPIEAANFLRIYSSSFEMIENPWPLLDMLIVHKKKFDKTTAGSIVVKTLVYLIQNYKNYRKSRLDNCRSVFTFFLNSNIKKNVVAAYKAVAVLYDDRFELPFKKIRNDMEDPDFVDSVLSLFEKMEDIPSVKSIISSLLSIARRDEKASKILIKMAKKYETASILINRQNDWMKFKLPTYIDTLRIFIAATSDFRDLQKLVVSDCNCISNLFVCSLKSDSKEKSFSCFEKILSKLNFNYGFLESLQEKRFFQSFFRKIIETINEDEDSNDLIFAGLRVFQCFIEIGICEEYSIFTKTLKKLAARKDEIADEAQSCIDMMTTCNRKKDYHKKYS